MCAHDTRLDRRSVLRGTVVGLFVGVAGCSVPGGEDDEQLQGPEGE